jgi:hypothetical protein
VLVALSPEARDALLDTKVLFDGVPSGAVAPDAIQGLARGYDGSTPAEGAAATAFEVSGVSRAVRNGASFLESQVRAYDLEITLRNGSPVTNQEIDAYLKWPSDQLKTRTEFSKSSLKPQSGQYIEERVAFVSDRVKRVGDVEPRLVHVGGSAPPEELVAQTKEIARHYQVTVVYEYMEGGVWTSRSVMP